jgi:hypothetical protein
MWSGWAPPVVWLGICDKCRHPYPSVSDYGDWRFLCHQAERETNGLRLTGYQCHGMVSRAPKALLAAYLLVGPEALK